MSKQNNFRMSLLAFLFSFPQAYLAVLLAFDLKYYDAKEMAFTVPIYPWPMYLKFVLSVISLIVTSSILLYFIYYQTKKNDTTSDQKMQESEAGLTQWN